MATAPTLYWYQLDSGTLGATYFGQLDATVAELCSENAVTAPTAPWQNSIGGALFSQWQTQVDTAVRALCTALSVAEPIPLISGSNAGQFQSEYAESLDGAVRALCAAPPPYHADAVHFDGANSSLHINSLTVANSPIGSFSFWIRQATDQDGEPIYAVDPDVNYVTFGAFDATFTVNLDFSDEEGDANVGLIGDNNCISLNVWHNVLCSWNTNFGAGLKQLKLYVDDVDVGNILDDTGGAFDVFFSAAPFFLGSDGGGGDPVMDIADFWFAPGQSLLTTGDIPEAMRRKFIDENGKPVDLGADGSSPTGTAPAIFFSGTSAAFPTNRGTGGAFTLTGSLTDASTSPSD